MTRLQGWVSNLHTNRDVSVAQIIANCQVPTVAVECLVRLVVIHEVILIYRLGISTRTLGTGTSFLINNNQLFRRPILTFNCLYLPTFCIDF